MSESYDPTNIGFGISIVHPMVIQKGQTQADRQMREWRTWLKELAERPESVPAGWAVKSPDEHLDRLSIGRWSFREVKAQFFSDTAYDASQGTDPDCGAVRPKIRWLGLSGPLHGKGLPEGDLSLGNLRLGVLRAVKPGRKKAPPPALGTDGKEPDSAAVPEAEVELLDGKMDVFSLLSVAMVELLVIQLQFPKGLPLSRAMQVSHLAAHVDPADWILVALPHALVSKLNKRRFEARAAAPEPPPATGSTTYPLMKEDISLVMHFIHSRPGAEGEVDHFSRSRLKDLLGPSLPVLLQESLLAKAPVREYWAPFHGRIPIAPRYLLPVGGPDAKDAIGPEVVEKAWSEFQAVESLVARGLPHPVHSVSFPLPMAAIEGPEIATVHISGTQRFYITCEGFYAVGLGASEFDRTQWMGRVARDYLATWLLVLHQATVLQRISMDSYFGNERRDARDNEFLMARFLEFSTEYDFTRVSPQRNIQALYRTSREVLGVNSMVDEVSSELHRWVDDESRKEQKALNSVAVLALLAAVATSFVGLNLSCFNNDSQISLFFSEEKLLPGWIWFWLPLGVVAVFAVARRSLRAHLARVARLLWRK